jgi:hypothetical protein
MNTIKLRLKFLKEAIIGVTAASLESKMQTEIDTLQWVLSMLGESEECE